MSMAHDEYVDSLCKADDDLDIDDLLLAVMAHSKAERTSQSQGYQPVVYTTSHATIHCQGCSTTYKGNMTHVEGMDNLYDGYTTKWCPRCIGNHEKEWWQQCFRMVVEGSVKFQSDGR